MKEILTSLKGLSEEQGKKILEEKGYVIDDSRGRYRFALWFHIFGDTVGGNQLTGVVCEKTY